MRTLHSKVTTIANRLVSQGYNRPHAMVKAWTLVKLPRLETKVAGVTYGNRQKAIEHLTRYAPEAISIRLERERDNPIDRNAVAVWAAVEGKGSTGAPGKPSGLLGWVHMGYLPRALAAFIAPLMDAGKAVGALFREVRGGGDPWMSLGLGIEVRA